MIYNFDEINNRLGTYCTQWDFIQDRFGEKDLLPFSISDTDFKAPKQVVDNVRKVIDSGIYGYTRWNHHDYKGSIASYFGRRHNTDIDENWIVYSPSVLYSVSLLVRLLTKPKDKVVTFTPMYDSFFSVIDENERKRVDSPLKVIDGIFQIDFEDLENKLSSASLFLLCSPHNPTGRVWTKEEVDKMIYLCKKYNVKILSDEIHMDVVIGNNPHISLLQYMTEYDELYVLSSASKTFNIPGLLGSYCIISNKDVRDNFVHYTRKVDFLNSISLPGLIATMTAYTECDDYVDQLVEYVRNNMQYLKEYIDSELPDFSFHIPDATYLAWIDISKVPFTSAEVQDALIHVGKVAIMAGETYGMDKYLRLNCGCPLSKLKDGLNRLKLSMDYLYSKKG